MRGHDKGVKMSEVRYEAPATASAAVALLAGASGPARVLAGGSDLLIQMRPRLHGPQHDVQLLVDLKGIAELTALTEEKGGYRIGAAMACMALVENTAFTKTWPGVTDAVKLIGSIQIKGRASVGGNVCNASPAADSVPALIAAGAVASVLGPAGRRDIAVEDIAAAPGKNILAKGEIVTSFLLPKRAPRSGDAYLRFTPRTEMDIAVVGVAVNLTLDDKGVCSAARIGLGAVAERVLLVPSAAATLIGTKVDEAALTKLAAAISAACRPIDDKRGTIAFRTKVAGVLARRATLIALARAQGGH